MTIPVLFDTECYKNYFLAAFRSVRTGKVVTFERTIDRDFDRSYFRDMLKNHCLIGFNSRMFDLPLCWFAYAGYNNEALKRIVNQIIYEGMKPWELETEYKVRFPQVDSIDLIELPYPGGVSLKLYNGRLHGRRMQDLPYAPESELEPYQMRRLKEYCINDLDATGNMLRALDEPIQLRIAMGKEYRIDLRSKSDAQIAEAVIKQKLEDLTGERVMRPTIKGGTAYHYRVPDFIYYRLPVLKDMLEAVRSADFRISGGGRMLMPDALKDLKIPIGKSVYRMGIGGLHSTEKRISYYADDETIICDRDVTSYYPAIILNLELYPRHLGRDFLRVYRAIFERRLREKKAGNKLVADSLKIVLNGLFGKLGSAWSVLYSPDHMIQVTVTGQLALLKLIEELERCGIPVISANTDGVLIKCDCRDEQKMLAIVAWWEEETGFSTEETRYSSYHSRDVNNYLAIKQDGGYKTKGSVFANPWGSKTLDYRSQLGKNPTNQICVDAVTDYLTSYGFMNIEHTITNCRDITKFVTIRTVAGGAEKDGEYLGKAIRWYYANGVEGVIRDRTNGNKVARSDGAKPLMLLPDEFPNDVNFDWYIRESYDLLEDVGIIVQRQRRLDLLELFFGI